jgi:hypothetical protein
MNGVKNEAYTMLYLCACALNSTVPDKEKIRAADPKQLYGICEFHSLTALVCTALESAGIRSKMFAEAKAKAVRKTILLDAERANAEHFMEQNGIWYMPLKGVILKDLYPKIGMRQMSDNDILFDEKYRAQLRDFMKRRGYEVESYGKDSHDCYIKPPVYNYEMHVSLFGELHEKRFREYYRGVKERLIPCGGMAYRFSDEDFYVYITAHAYKHYSGGGTGLRSLADCYVYNRAKGSGLNRGYIETEFEKLGIADFEREMRSLSEKIFSDPENFCVDNLEENERNTLDFILISGTYGTLENSISQKLSSMKNGEAVTPATKLRYIFRRFFPEPKTIITFYPFFGRHRLLLPLGYIYRIFKGIFTKSGKLIKEIRMIKEQ